MPDYVTKENIRLPVGTKLYAVATKRFQSIRSNTVLITSQPGYVGMFPAKNGALWFYDTCDNAEAARDMIRGRGIDCAKEICLFVTDTDGVPLFHGEVKEDIK